jgi:hypothetical protein
MGHIDSAAYIKKITPDGKLRADAVERLSKAGRVTMWVVSV